MTSRVIVVLLISILLLLSGCILKTETNGHELPYDQRGATPQSSTESVIATASAVPDRSNAAVYVHVPDRDIDSQSSAYAKSQPVRVSNRLDDGVEIVAEYKGWNGDWPSVYLIADEPIYDLLVSKVSNENGYDENQPYTYYTIRAVANDDWCVEDEALIYVPELAAGQAICLPDRLFFNTHCQYMYCRVAYTNIDGEFEAYLLTGGEFGCLPLVQVTPRCMNEKLDSYYLEESQLHTFGYSNLFPDDFRELMLTGAFDAYLPTGFCITGGSLGDINNDGFEDAIIYLSTSGMHKQFYRGIMPMFLLTGQPAGGYNVERKIGGALRTPYDDPSYCIAGKGYIDIVYYSDYAPFIDSLSYTSRFWYDESQHDWLLHEFSKPFAFGEAEQSQSSFVRALPDIMELPISKFEKYVYYYCRLDNEYFDAYRALTVPSFSGYYKIYTLAVKLNEEAGLYEGYIHVIWENEKSSGFIQTICGEYIKGSKLTVTVNEDDVSFIVQGDTWTYTEREGCFIRQPGKTGYQA